MSDNIKNSAYNTKNGRYVLGGVTEVSTFALEWWDKGPNRLDSSDIVYYVEKKYEGRPELLGYVFYGDVGLWWIICQYNGVLDPFEEIVEGKLLFIPTLDRVKSEIINSDVKVGGIPTTRN